ncbi:MAG: helical backbone metal receptor [Anaerolineae bacterium]
MRIMSLVPSTTETLFALGVGDAVVGRTAFCVLPTEALTVPEVGGTKTPNLARIVALRPDLILVNAEENRAEDVGTLMRVAPVHSFYPRTVEHAIADLRVLGRLVGRTAGGETLAAQARGLLAEVHAAAKPFRYAYLIWMRPWMVAAGGTYVADFLAQAGGVNVFADAAIPYPAITLDDLFDRGPDVVFLSSEPYPFAERHVDELARLSPRPDFWRQRIRLVDGRACGWHGVALLDGLGWLARFSLAYQAQND